MIIINQWNQTARLYEIQVTIINSRAIFVAVTSERRVKRIICKTWSGALTNSARPDQTPQNAASVQDMHCLLKLRKLRLNETVLSPRLGPFSQPTLGENRPPVRSVLWLHSSGGSISRFFEKKDNNGNNLLCPNIWGKIRCTLFVNRKFAACKFWMSLKHAYIHVILTPPP